MPILTKATVTKGSPANFTLDKTLLKALPTDAYYQDDTNWKTVVMKFKSATGKQRSEVIFDATQASPVGKFLVSSKALNSFEIKEIIIYDFDKGRYVIPRSALTSSEFDLSLGAAGGTVTGTAYRYIKLKFFEAYNSIGNPANSNSVSITELQFKYDGSVQSLAGKTITNGTPALTNGLMPVDNSGYWNVNFAANPELIVDLGVAKVVTDILMAGQGSDPDQVFNIPKKFEVFGSNDDVTYTSIKAFNLTAPVLGTGPGEWKAGSLTSFSLAAPATTSVSGRYFEIEMSDLFNLAGQSVVLSEIEVIEGGVAKTLSSMGASILDNNFSITGSPSNGSFAGDAGNYMYSTATPSVYVVVDLGSVKSIDGFALGLTAFNGALGPNGLNRVPATVKLYKSDTVGTHLGGTLAKTLSYVETDWPKDTRKDILF